VEICQNDWSEPNDFSLERLSSSGLAEDAATSVMQEEYRATAAQYRRLAVAETISAGVADELPT
jgi:hypothetical protein